MGMVVRTNMAALGANNSLAQASKAQQNGMQKLYTGFKINAAKDDASGLAISEKMKNQIKALDTAKDNCEDGANMIQTAEGYMKETHDILTRMTELAEKSANGLLEKEDRTALQNEMDQLCSEIDRMASTANFNGVKLLDGSLGSAQQVKIESKAATATEKGVYKYVAPANTSSNTNSLAGGRLTLATHDAADSDASNGKYKISEAPAAGSDANSATIKAKKINDDGTLAASDTSFTLKAKEGDTVTIQSDGTGTSTNGLKLSAATKSVGGVFTYKDVNGTKGWYTDDNIALDSAAKITGSASADDVFEYNDDVAQLQDAGKDKNGIDLQIGESSTTADRMKVSINSFHTDALFGGLSGTVNRSADFTDTANIAAVKTKDNSAVSTYGNGSATGTDQVKSYSIDITDKDSASAAADAIRQISSYVSDERGKLGAQQNRLEHTVNNLATASENTTAAKSRILDTDMAKEMMEYTSKNVIAQAAQSMLAQANSQPQNVLSLLQ